ncbi:MAG: tRNA guanosine(34) transglycosylase Tgt [Myxococcota bacterium]
MSPRFEIVAGSASQGPRTGRLHTAHGTLDTPAFLPVGTHGAVRGLAPRDLVEVGVQGLLANTYHLHLRPGEALIAKLGGLHRFMGWDGPILTDSGGFQIHSLDPLCERSEAGVRFTSPLDGRRIILDPESSIRIQEALGADLIVTLDEFDPIGDDRGPGVRERVRAQMERTVRWSERCLRARTHPGPLLFGIVQGGGFPELRRESAERTARLGFEAFAIGGLGVGESRAERALLVETVVSALPSDRPRYLMGLGTPEDLIQAVARGIDLFDCVVPTRHARHGSVFTRRGPLHLRNARFRDDPEPLDPDDERSPVRAWSRAYLRHLLVSNEMLGARLLSWHNLGFYTALLSEARAAIAAGRFERWQSRWLERYHSGARAVS